MNTVNEEKTEACSCKARLLCVLLAAFSKHGIDIVVGLVFSSTT